MITTYNPAAVIPNRVLKSIYSDDYDDYDYYFFSYADCDDDYYFTNSGASDGTSGENLADAFRNDYDFTFYDPGNGVFCSSSSSFSSFSSSYISCNFTSSFSSPPSPASSFAYASSSSSASSIGGSSLYPYPFPFSSSYPFPFSSSYPGSSPFSPPGPNGGSLCFGILSNTTSGRYSCCLYCRTFDRTFGRYFCAGTSSSSDPEAFISLISFYKP